MKAPKTLAAGGVIAAIAAVLIVLKPKWLHETPQPISRACSLGGLQSLKIYTASNHFSKENGFTIEHLVGERTFFRRPEPVLLATDLESAERSLAADRRDLLLIFSPEGGKKLGDVSRAQIGEYLIFSKGDIQRALEVQSPIVDGRAQISFGMDGGTNPLDELCPQP